MTFTLVHRVFRERSLTLLLTGLLGLACPVHAVSLPIQDPNNILTSAQLQVLQTDLAQLPSYRLSNVQSVLIESSGSPLNSGQITGNQLIINVPTSAAPGTLSFGSDITNALASQALSQLSDAQNQQLVAWFQPFFGVGSPIWSVGFKAIYPQWYSVLQGLLTQADALNTPSGSAELQLSLFFATLLKNPASATTSSFAFGDSSGQTLQVQNLPFLKTNSSLQIGAYTFQISTANVVTEILSGRTVIAQGLSVPLGNVTVSLLNAISTSAPLSAPIRRPDSPGSVLIGAGPTQYQPLNLNTAQQLLEVLQGQARTGTVDVMDPALSAHPVERVSP